MKKSSYIELTTSAGRDKFYHTEAWRLMRRIVLTEHPFCVKCLLNDVNVLATEVDHIIDIKDAPHLCFNKANLQSLCKSCHSAKTFNENRDKTTFGKTNTSEVLNKKWPNVKLDK